MRRKFFTAFYPQTDGTTERQNQTIKKFLRYYCNYNQNNWARLLAAGQFRVNNNINRITGMTPFDIILRFKLKMRINIETAIIENNYTFSGEVPAARQEVKLRAKDANLLRDI
jgi:hypothetical protein